MGWEFGQKHWEFDQIDNEEFGHREVGHRAPTDSDKQS